MSNSSAQQTSQATLGGGCFWCVEAVFLNLVGVRSVVSGYAGGSIADPSYEQVCTGQTGHAEVVQITFDPAEISFKQLLEVFWRTHDPTTLNRQDADMGTQYRSVVFYHDDGQRDAAERMKHELNASGEFAGDIVTEITPLTHFYPAEDYHQNYFARHPQQPYCFAKIPPKLQKLRDAFPERVKTSQVR